jgi:hypothetical protein
MELMTCRENRTKLWVDSFTFLTRELIQMQTGVKRSCLAAIVILLPAFFLLSCTHMSNNGANAKAESSLFQRWEHLPAVPIESALAKAMTYLRDRQQDLSGGYLLEAGRGEDCWWFDFKLLPRSPDFEINIRVFDSGSINASPLAPLRAQVTQPTK